MPDTATYEELLRCYQILSKLDENERPLRSIAEGQPGWEASQKKLSGLTARRAELDATVAALEVEAALGVTPELLRGQLSIERAAHLAVQTECDRWAT